MKKSEVLTRFMLVAIVIAALIAVILQILNEKTNTLETTYEIITFSVALVAVILAVLQGLANARTTRELHRITREIQNSLAELREVNHDNDDLRKIIAADEKLDQESLKILNRKSR
jgi:uncharacterized membrane protein (DUF106 family)